MCKVRGCKQNHQRHYCKECKNKDSNHFSSRCTSAQSSRAQNSRVNNSYHGNNHNKIQYQPPQQIYQPPQQRSNGGEFGVNLGFKNDNFNIGLGNDKFNVGFQNGPNGWGGGIGFRF